MNYRIGTNVNVKCEKGWKIGVIKKVVGDLMFVRIDGLKNLKKVNVNHINMYF